VGEVSLCTAGAQWAFNLSNRSASSVGSVARSSATTGSDCFTTSARMQQQHVGRVRSVARARLAMPVRVVVYVVLVGET
jgi:hypothetical protein